MGLTCKGFRRAIPHLFERLFFDYENNGSADKREPVK